MSEIITKTDLEKFKKSIIRWMLFLSVMTVVIVAITIFLSL